MADVLPPVPVLQLSDKELLDELESLTAHAGVMLRSCRSGVKMQMGFPGCGPLVTLFGGKAMGEFASGDGSVYVERGDPLDNPADHTGSDVRALISKAVSFARAYKGKLA